MAERRLENLEPIAAQLVATRDVLVLLILTEGSQHGAEIVQRLGEIIWESDLPDTTIYQNLRRLKKQKYIVKGVKRPGAAPNWKVYQIAPLGLLVLKSYLKVLQSADLDCLFEWKTIDKDQVPAPLQDTFVRDTVEDPAGPSGSVAGRTRRRPEIDPSN